MSATTNAAVIAIDGPAASGKGTLARRLAGHFGFAYLDTGLIYRAVGRKAQAQALAQGAKATAEGIVEQYAIAAARSLRPYELEDFLLRGDEAAQLASRVAVLPEVRSALLDFQRHFAAHPPEGKPGAVIDGRDIGTVVCPLTPYKIFITASLETRARRREKELRERGIEAIHERVLQDMKTRDERDSKRALAPLTQAKDAFFLDTTALDADAVFAAAVGFLVSRGLVPPPTV